VLQYSCGKLIFCGLYNCIGKKDDGGTIMKNPIHDVTQLKPVATKAVQSFYGEAVKNIEMIKAEKFPLFRTPKQGWLVEMEFNDDVYEYHIQIDVQMADGRITRTHELYREPIIKKRQTK